MKAPEDKPNTPRAKRTRKPRHRTVARAYDFPMQVSPGQHALLMMWLGACWRLRDDLVADRQKNRKENKVARQRDPEAPEVMLHYLNRADQYKAVTEYARRDTALSKVHSQVRQNVAVRVDEGYKRFFEAVKEGRSGVKPPKFIEFKKYRSITYPQYGSAAHIRNNKLYLSGLGEFVIYGYRKARGRKKTVTIKFKQGRWHCIVTAEMQEKDIAAPVRTDDTRPDAGIDTGLEKLMTDSFGFEYDPPKAWYEYRAKLRKEQKKFSRQFEARKKVHSGLVAKAKAMGEKPLLMKDIPYSNRLRKQIKTVAKIHTKIERIRDHHHKKNASVIESRYRRVAVEEHPVKFMIRNRNLAKLASDRAIHKQKLALKSKLGKRYREAPNRTENGGNSQTCPCGAPVPKGLKDRVHVCGACGLVGKRDHVSANMVSIIAFGHASITLSKQVGAGQAFNRRGEDKAQRGESVLCEPGRSISLSRASESPVKRRPPEEGETPRVGNLPWEVRPACMTG